MAGFITGIADQLKANLEDQQAAAAYAPLINSVYGGSEPAQQPGVGSWLKNMFGGAQQPAPVAAVPAAPGMGGVGSDAVAAAPAAAEE